MTENVNVESVRKLFGKRFAQVVVVVGLLCFFSATAMLIRKHYYEGNQYKSSVEHEDENNGRGGGDEGDLPSESARPTSSFVPPDFSEVIGRFPDNLSEWLTENIYHQPNGDLLCAKAETGFPHVAMWLNQEIPLIFDEIRTSFVAQPSQSDPNVPAPVDLFLGNYEEIPILRCHVLETSYKQIGCMVYDPTDLDGEPLLRAVPYNLKKGEVMPGSRVDINMQATVEPDDYVRYTMSLDYDSTDGMRVEGEGFEIGTIKPPYQNLEKVAVQFGIGTSERECIKPEFYSVNF